MQESSENVYEGASASFEGPAPGVNERAFSVLYGAYVGWLERGKGLRASEKAFLREAGALAFETFIWLRDELEVEGSGQTLIEGSEWIIAGGPFLFKRRDIPSETLDCWARRVDRLAPGYSAASKGMLMDSPALSDWRLRWRLEFFIPFVKAHCCSVN